MSWKLAIHTALCAGLAVMVVMHIVEGRRRVVFGALLLAALWLGAAPWLHKLLGIGPRMTIHPAQFLFLTASVFLVTPARGRRLSILETEFDQPQVTEPAPLRAVK